MQKVINNLLIALIAFNVFFVSLGALFYPLASIDAVSIWLLKAKAFYLANGLPVEILKDKFFLYTHPQYPLLLPFIYYVFYLALGTINENAVSFLNPLAYLLIIIIAYKLLKKMKFTTTMSLLFTYIYSMFSPLLAQGGRGHAGDADIFIVLINWLAISLSFDFFKNKSYKILCILIALIMISSQIKGEGIFLTSIILFLPLTKKEKFFSIAVSLLPFLAWRGIIAYYQIPNDFYFIIPGLNEAVLRIFDIFYYTLLEMIKINNWYIFWPVFLLFIISKKNKSQFIKKFILPSFLLICFLFFTFYLFVSVSPKIYVPPSIDRILIQVSPFYFLVFAEIGSLM